MKTSVFIRQILSEGAVFVKKKGSHHYYRLTNGAILQVPTGGRDHTDCKPYIVRRYEKLRADPKAESRNLSNTEAQPTTRKTSQ